MPDVTQEAMRLARANIVSRTLTLIEEIGLVAEDIDGDDWLQVQRRALFIEHHMREVRERARLLHRWSEQQPGTNPENLPDVRPIGDRQN